MAVLGFEKQAHLTWPELKLVRFNGAEITHHEEDDEDEVDQGEQGGGPGLAIKKRKKQHDLMSDDADAGPNISKATLKVVSPEKEFDPEIAVTEGLLVPMQFVEDVFALETIQPAANNPADILPPEHPEAAIFPDPLSPVQNTIEAQPYTADVVPLETIQPIAPQPVAPGTENPKKNFLIAESAAPVSEILAMPSPIIAAPEIAPALSAEPAAGFTLQPERQQEIQSGIQLETVPPVMSIEQPVSMTAEVIPPVLTVPEVTTPIITPMEQTPVILETNFADAPEPVIQTLGILPVVTPDIPQQDTPIVAGELSAATSAIEISPVIVTSNIDPLSVNEAAASAPIVMPVSETPQPGAPQIISQTITIEPEMPTNAQHNPQTLEISVKADNNISAENTAVPVKVQVTQETMEVKLPEIQTAHATATFTVQTPTSSIELQTVTTESSPVMPEPLTRHSTITASPEAAKPTETLPYTAPQITVVSPLAPEQKVETKIKSLFVAGKTNNDPVLPASEKAMMSNVQSTKPATSVVTPPIMNVSPKETTGPQSVKPAFEILSKPKEGTSFSISARADPASMLFNSNTEHICNENCTHNKPATAALDNSAPKASPSFVVVGKAEAASAIFRTNVEHVCHGNCTHNKPEAVASNNAPINKDSIQFSALVAEKPSVKSNSEFSLKPEISFGFALSGKVQPASALFNINNDHICDENCIHSKPATARQPLITPSFGRG